MSVCCAKPQPAVQHVDVRQGEDKLTKFQGFKSFFMATCGQMGPLRLLEQHTPVKVGVPDHSREALEAEHGAETVRKTYQLWSMLLQKIPYALHSSLLVVRKSAGRSFASTTSNVLTQKGSVHARLVQPLSEGG